MTFKSGQINIEFLGGAILFFSAVIFLINSSLDAIPQYAKYSERNSLELNLITISRILFTEGYWKNNSDSGTDWQNHLEDIKFLGFFTNGSIDLNKINALNKLDYEKIKILFGIKEDFWIDVDEFHVIDTSRSFEKDKWSSFIPFEPPSDDDFASTNGRIHYGRENSSYLFLIEKNNEYSVLYIHNSTRYFKYYLNENSNLSINGKKYSIGIDTGWDPYGNIVILKRNIISYGRDLPELSKESSSLVKFGNNKNKIYRIRITIWRRGL